MQKGSIHQIHKLLYMVRTRVYYLTQISGIVNDVNVYQLYSNSEKYRSP